MNVKFCDANCNGKCICMNFNCDSVKSCLVKKLLKKIKEAKNENT